ncbi:MAG TPA: branched-chain amino acid ABC transporter permease [Acidimicrobiia bacterium]|jgi:branched-chain amino acid transport system permease protein
MRGRPLLYTSYEADQALLNTTTKRVMLGLFLLVLVTIPFQLIPGIKFMGQEDWLRLLTTTAIFVIGAFGLNILTGLAGQVSLGHAFFMAIGAYTAVWLGGPEGGPLIGLGLPIWIWLPAAGLVAALIGVAVGPTAVRVRGLYLAIVTLGLVFIGEYVWRNWNSLTGGAQVGRDFPPLQFRWWKEDPPVFDATTPSTWFGVEVSAIAKSFFVMTLLAVLFSLLAKNLQRTRVGRAFMSIRDRDIAAEIMGVNEFAYKLLAFGISSFYAGIAGALLASFVTRVIPERWDLALSVQFIAIVLIGGVGTVTGAVLGTGFVVLLPRVVQNFTLWLQATAVEGKGVLSAIADVFVATTPDDFGLVNTFAGVGPGLSVAQLNLVLYGLLIIGFLIFEPLGLYGIWLRIRNYWKGWPFTY